MKHFLILIISSILAQLSVSAQVNYITKQQAEEEISYLISYIEDVHVAPYTNISKENLQVKASDLISAINDSIRVDYNGPQI